MDIVRDTGDSDEPLPLDLARGNRFLGTGPVVDMGAYEYAVRDCNCNQVADHVDIAVGTSDDCNANAAPDECELTAGKATDCDVNGTLDECDLMAGNMADCNENGVPDSCDIAGGTSSDSNQNGTPDECEETLVPHRVEYGYDYMGRRVRRQMFDWDPVGEDWDGPVQDTKYVNDGWRVIEELDGLDQVNPDATTRQYTWGLDLAAQAGSANSLEQAGGIGGLLAANDTAGTTTTTDDRTFLYFYDANGNVGQVVTTFAPWYGEISAHYEYTPYGQRLNAPAAGEYDQPYRFSTKPFDSWTGVGYWGYRWYSPRMGRFLNRDPGNTLGVAFFPGQRQGTRAVLRDDIDENCYEGMQNCTISWLDSDGRRAATQPPSPTRGAPANTDCGIQIHQSPWCLIGGGHGGQYGHTWLTWGGGGTGEASDCPPNYINGERSKCQKNYVNNKWHVRKVDSGVFDDGNSTRTCASASCAEIKECLLRRMETSDCDFDIKHNNCRHFVDKAMNNCCLKRGDLFYVDWLAPLRYCCSSCAKHDTGV